MVSHVSTASISLKPFGSQSMQLYAIDGDLSRSLNTQRTPSLPLPSAPPPNHHLLPNVEPVFDGDLNLHHAPVDVCWLQSFGFPSLFSGGMGQMYGGAISQHDCWMMSHPPRTWPASSGSLDPERGMVGRRKRRRAVQSSVHAASLERLSTSGFDPDRCDEIKEWIEKGGGHLDKAIGYLKGKVWPASCNDKGCRVVQFALEKATSKDQALLVEELHTHVWEAVNSPHANYVLQSVIERVGNQTARFIIEECRGRGVEVAKHRYGCRIVCRILEFFSREELKVALVDEVLEEVSALSRHSFGHHVVQGVMEHGTAEQIKRIVAAMRLDLQKMAVNRHASFIVEGAFKVCSQEEKDAFVRELLTDEGVKTMASNQFGGFVLKVLLQEPGETPEVLRGCLLKHWDYLRENRYGRKMLEDVFGVIGEAENGVAEEAARAAREAEEGWGEAPA